MTFYYDLKAVQQESQVTQNVYLLQKTVQKIPKEYQSKYADVCMEKKNQPGETQWKILTDFLMTQVAMLEQHMPWELEVKAVESLGKDYCEFYQKSAGHRSKDCPKKYGRVVNSLNIHDEDNFKKQQERMGK